MDFDNLSDDEFADAAKAFFDSLHARHDAMADGPLKKKIGKLLVKAHAAMNSIQAEAKSATLIQPMSGGDQKAPT